LSVKIVSSLLTWLQKRFCNELDKMKERGSLMKKISVMICFNLIFFVCIFLYGCATTSEITKLNGIWKYDKYSGGYLDQIMIVGKPRLDDTRIQYENYITKALEKRKIDIIPSYTVIPEMEDLTLENIVRAADAANIKTVLATKVVGVDEKNVIFQQSVSWDYIPTPNGVVYRPYIEGPREEKYTKVRLETGLFEIESGKLLWAATSDIMNPGSADEAIKDFSKAIIKQLIKDGYIH
jgi:hypothetical protein